MTGYADTILDYRLLLRGGRSPRRGSCGSETQVLQARGPSPGLDSVPVLLWNLLWDGFISRCYVFSDQRVGHAWNRGGARVSGLTGRSKDW